MKTTVLLVGILGMAAMACAEDPVYPVKVSSNGRYFVDQKGTPVFWLGTTQWQLFRDYRLEDVRLILEKSKDKGFTFIQVMLVGVGDGTKANVNGQKPWNDNDPAMPNEAYFKHVDAVLQMAREHNEILLITIYHQTNRKFLTLEKARAWAEWVASRYREVPNIVWCMVPEAKPEFVPILRDLSAGLRAGDAGCHLITVEPDPSPFSSSFLHEEKWLDFNCIQTWKPVELIYPMVTKDYTLRPVKPVLMAEGAYEHGSEYEFDVTPLWIRRQAYYSYFCGGHHTYGHNDSWRVLPAWKEALDAPGAVQMRTLKKVFMDRQEWWNLIPDQSIFTSGGNTNGQVLNLAARHKDGRWLMAYLGSKSSCSIDLRKLNAPARSRAFWVDPRTGDSVPIGNVANQGEQSFDTPAGWEDALLIMDAESSTR